jgi:hypothetical protein
MLETHRELSVALKKIYRSKTVRVADKLGRYFPVSEDAYLMNEGIFRANGYKAGGYEQAIQNQLYSGSPVFPVIPVVTTPISIQSPMGLYAIAKTVAGVITITVPAAVAGSPSAGGDDGKHQIWFNNQTQANIVSFTGANLLSVGVAKTTITFTAALVGEFARTMSIGGAYICLDIVTTGGGTLA